MIFNLSELIDMVIMSAYLGFIFSDMLPRHRENYDPLKHYSKKHDWSSFKYAIYATAPAVIFHELAHKFVAMGFGLDAVFMAFYRDTFTLSLAAFSVLAKFTGFGFIFFVPGFVSISGTGTALEFSLTAVAGPLFNLVLWLAAYFVLKSKKYSKKHFLFWTLTKKINMLLFIFNILPIPGFDGYKFLMCLLSLF